MAPLAGAGRQRGTRDRTRRRRSLIPPSGRKPARSSARQRWTPATHGPPADPGPADVARPRRRHPTAGRRCRSPPTAPSPTSRAPRADRASPSRPRRRQDRRRCGSAPFTSPGSRRCAGRRDIELRLSDAGLDVLKRSSGAAIGRLEWTEIEAIDLPAPRRGLRGRRRFRELHVRTGRGQAQFELPGLTDEELNEHVQPMLDRPAQRRTDASTAGSRLHRRPARAQPATRLMCVADVAMGATGAGRA